VKERDEKGKMVACGTICNRHDEHDEEDCKCKKHIRQKETDEWKDSKLRIPKEDVTDEEKETRLTQEEKDEKRTTIQKQRKTKRTTNRTGRVTRTRKDILL